MKKYPLFLILLSVFLFVTVSAGFAGSTIDKITQKKELIIGTSAELPPLTFITKDGTIEGLDIELGQMIAAILGGVKCTVVNMSFDELISALEGGKIDMIIACMTITPEICELPMWGHTSCPDSH
jgi:polar amino acid transport system substrate-binding protein